MTMEELLQAIKDNEHRLSIINNHLREREQWEHGKRIVGITANGSWSVNVTPDELGDVIEKRKIAVETELGRLYEAKRAAEITMAGWLNLSKGESDEQSKNE